VPTHFSVYSTTSQATSGIGYDPSGDVIYDGTNQYLYDADGRICAVYSSPGGGVVSMTGYLYDADGTRIAKGSISNWSCDPAVSGFVATNQYSLGPAGEQITEMVVDGSGTASWQHTNVFAAGKLLATYDSDVLHFHLDDPLGTWRAQTDYAGVLEQTCGSLPFGDNLACTGSNQYPTEQHFTGKERDSESGNDYFGARYYASSMGRWMSPDPGWFMFANMLNPRKRPAIPTGGVAGLGVTLGHGF
jgi:RHS repeat-associated protein